MTIKGMMTPMVNVQKPKVLFTPNEGKKALITGGARGIGFAFRAAGRAGGERAQMILRSFMVPFQPRILQGPELHLADSSNEFDADGRLSNDRYEHTLHNLMQKLRAEAGF